MEKLLKADNIGIFAFYKSNDFILVFDSLFKIRIVAVKQTDIVAHNIDFFRTIWVISKSDCKCSKVKVPSSWKDNS